MIDSSWRRPRLTALDVVTALAASVLLGVAVASWLRFTDSGHETVQRFMRLEPGPVMTLFAVFYAIGGVGIAVGAARHGRFAGQLLGLRPAHWLWGLAATVATVGLSFALTSAALPALGDATQSDLTPSSVALLGRLIDTPLRLAVAVVVVALIAPVVEELAFRGLLFGWIEGRFGGWIAVVVTTILFGLAHSNPLSPEVGQILAATALGLPLGLARHWTGSLWPSIAAHAVNNGIAVLGVYLAR
jgi:membrane protease YdiL (CAAX protease family)